MKIRYAYRPAGGPWGHIHMTLCPWGQKGDIHMTLCPWGQKSDIHMTLFVGLTVQSNYQASLCLRCYAYVTITSRLCSPTCMSQLLNLLCFAAPDNLAKQSIRLLVCSYSKLQVWYTTQPLFLLCFTAVCKKGLIKRIFKCACVPKHACIYRTHSKYASLKNNHFSWMIHE